MILNKLDSRVEPELLRGPKEGNRHLCEKEEQNNRI